jgi:hypothetical protein
VQLLVERIDISPEGADIKLRTEGLTNLVADLGAVRPETRREEPRPTGDGTVTVRVPISIRRRGGRKLVLAPDGANVATGARHPTRRQRHGQGDCPGVSMAGHAESGEYATIREIGAAEKINETYVGRVLRLTLLAPNIVETILGGRQPAEMTLAGLMRRFLVGWDEQIRVSRGR